MNPQRSGEDEWTQRWSSWDYHFERIRTDDEITDVDKARILCGFQALREIMGDPWLAELVRSRHPLFHRLANLVPWSQLSVARVGLQLQALQTAPSFDRLQKKLASRDQYAAAEAELEVASCFKEAGFLIEFYPSVDPKEADLRITIDGKEFYVEVTVVGESEEARRASQTLDELTWPFLPERNVAIGGRIYKALSAPHIREVKHRIATAIEEARARQECQEVVEPGVVEFFIAPRDKTDELKSWQQQKGISGLQGPPIEVDEVRRIKRRLEEKNRQLPMDKPGLIVVYAHALISQFFEHDFYESLVNQLEEAVYEHENLILGAIIAYGSSSSAKVAKKRDDYILGHRPLYTSITQEDVLIIKNRYAKFAIDQQIVSALLQSR